LTVLTEETLHILEETPEWSLHKCGLCASTLSNVGHTSCHRNFLCPNTMLPGYVSLPHSVPCHLQIAMFSMSRNTKFRC
jgi:hypothetical protein